MADILLALTKVHIWLIHSAGTHKSPDMVVVLLTFLKVQTWLLMVFEIIGAQPQVGVCTNRSRPEFGPEPDRNGPNRTGPGDSGPVSGP